MKLSLAILALATITGGSSAFQAAPSLIGRTATLNNRMTIRKSSSNSELMAATLDGATVVNGQKRKKTKQVSYIVIVYTRICES
jgi:hypothetical protein